MKLALVHEWFVNYAGSEKCVESFVNIWNDADVYCLVDFLNKDDRRTILKGKQTTKSFIQRLPFAEKKFRTYLPLFPLAIEQLDLSGYDIILSSSHAVAKGVLTKSNQLHICYCHTPMRYAWDLYHQYLKEEKLDTGLKGWIVKYFLHKIRIWDYTTVNRVDFFIANSQYTANRIKKIYDRESEVIYPPVDVANFPLEQNKEDYYVTASRFVPYKKIDLIADAFSRMPDKKLVVIGDGPDMEKIKSKATGRNIEITGYLGFEEMKRYFQKARAFIFAAEEDFGITLVEALACGTPVIAFNKGGAAEIVQDGITGIHFNEQTVLSLIDGIGRFEKLKDKFNPMELSIYAQKYSRQTFEKNIFSFIASAQEKHSG